MNTIRIDRIDLHCRGIEAATAQAALDHLGPALLRQLGAARQLLPLLPLREERAGERRAVQTPLNSPLPNPLPVRLAALARGRSRRGEGEIDSRPSAFLDSTAVIHVSSSVAPAALANAIAARVANEVQIHSGPDNSARTP